MQNLLFILMLFLLQVTFSESLSASSKVDSLIVKLGQESGAPTARLNNLIAFNLKNKSPKEAYIYAQRALIASIKYDLPRQQAFSFYNLAQFFVYSGEFDSAAHYAKALVSIAEQYSFDFYLGMGHLNLGNTYYRKSEFSKAREHFESANEAFLSAGSTRNVAVAITNIGLVNYHTGNYTSALEYYLDAEKLYLDSLKQHEEIGAIYNNIGDIYGDLHDYQRALEYYERSAQYNRKFQDYRRLCTSLRRAGKTYIALEDQFSARQLVEEAREYAVLLDDPVAILECDKQLVISHLKSGSMEVAEELVEKALVMLATLPDNLLLHAEFNYLKGRAGLLNNQFSLAEQNLITALNHASVLGSKKLEAEISRHLFEVYIRTDQTPKANKIALAYMNIRDSFLDNNIVKVVSAHQNYEKVKAEKQAVESGLRAQKLNEEANRVRLWYLSGFLTMAVLLTSIWLWYRYRLSRQKMINAVNNHKRATVEQKILNLEKEQALKSIEARLAGEEDERIRLGRELHDGIGGALGGIKLLLSRRTSQSDDQVIAKIDEVYREVKSISQNLIPPIFRSSTLSCILDNYLANISASSGIYVQASYFSSEQLNAIDAHLQTTIYRIVQEVIANAVKHSHCDRIDLQVVVHEGYINIIIEDNGRGFDVSLKHEGMGINNVRSRVKLLAGRLQIDSKIGVGTLFDIDIPDIRYGY